jgi:hypothetical protein
MAPSWPPHGRCVGPGTRAKPGKRCVDAFALSCVPLRCWARFRWMRHTHGVIYGVIHTCRTGDMHEQLQQKSRCVCVRCVCVRVCVSRMVQLCMTESCARVLRVAAPSTCVHHTWSPHVIDPAWSHVGQLHQHIGSTTTTTNDDDDDN